jgi:hypothetical protein
MAADGTGQPVTVPTPVTDLRLGDEFLFDDCRYTVVGGPTNLFGVIEVDVEPGSTLDFTESSTVLAVVRR